MEKKEFSKYNTLSLKGIAIIMMMFHHCFRTQKLFANYKVSFYPLNQDLVVDVSFFFKICVSIFVFITGYGLALSLKKLNSEYKWSKKELSDWVKKRLIKLLSGYCIIVILSWIICQIINGRVQTVYFKKNIIYGIVQMMLDFIGISNIVGTASFNSAWWYMSIAIAYVFSVPLFIKLFKKYGYFLVMAFVFFVPRIIGWNYVNSSYISFLPMLLLGIIFGENNLMVKVANLKINKNKYVSKALKFVIETGLFIILYIVCMKLPKDKFWEIRYAVIPIFMMCYFYEFIIDIPIIKHILEFLGKHSMNIFLIHEFLRSYYLSDFIYSFGNFVKIGIMLLLMSIGISIIIELVKKIIKYEKITNKMIESVGCRDNRIKEY